MSISPSAHRQLRSNTRRPARSRYSTATCSPSRPSSSLAFTRHHLHSDSAGGGQVTAERLRRLWTTSAERVICGQNYRVCRCRMLHWTGDHLSGTRAVQDDVGCPERREPTAPGPPSSSTWASDSKLLEPAAWKLLGSGTWKLLRSGTSKLLGIRNLEVALRKLLDVDVLERHD